MDKNSSTQLKLDQLWNRYDPAKKTNLFPINENPKVMNEKQTVNENNLLLLCLANCCEFRRENILNSNTTISSMETKSTTIRFTTIIPIEDNISIVNSNDSNYRSSHHTD